MVGRMIHGGWPQGARLSTGAGTQSRLSEEGMLPVWSSVDGTGGTAGEKDCLQVEGDQTMGSLNARFRSSASALKVLSSSAGQGTAG